MKTSIILPVLLNLALSSAARTLAPGEQTPETLLKDNAQIDINCELKDGALECATDRGSNPRKQNLLPLCEQIGGCVCSPLIGNKFGRKRFGGNDFSFTFVCRSS
ncbi:hypothetical protein MGU_01332 [Metarhizium guizhouense ARSEF 977]|uniref:Uncharacterized protein n=1 Tax=Metarhizium guizhouense (strain ARSEF 977) TaxID=1276136 RepID=A0A0B4HGH4_METGA|nr:hypothetical protein MGU_01332 [Metarhizium guizhouense ARSEF 977]